MMGFKLLSLLALCLVLTEAARHNRFNRLRRHRDQQRERLLNKPGATEQLLDEQYFTQKLDHFSQGTTTWNQRYWQNDQYSKDNGINFLNIGGEGPESPSIITYPTLPLVSWAKQLGARLWNLEHRFYGKSRPTKDQSVENLKYLDSRQALEDLAGFIKAKNKELNIKNPKWVVFGGSYPGALALWFRQNYPDLTVGAVGSSAPVELVTDFFDYLRVCEDSYRTYDSKCADNIKSGFDSLHSLLDTKSGRDTLDKTFGVIPTLASQNLTYTHLQNFASSVMGWFMEAVQYSRVNAGTFAHDASIPDICKIMTAPAINAVTRLVKVNQYMGPLFGESPDVLYDSYEDQVKELQEVSFDSDAADARSWVWQTCNEFGYFQSTTYNGIFGEDVAVNYYYNLCSDVYGSQFTVDYIRGRVQASVDHYGRAKDFNATNVVIPNGSLDPWHALGTYAQNNPTAIPYLIQNTAHCADMEPPSKADNDDLKNVRNTIFTNLKKWTGSSASQSRADRLTQTEEVKVEPTVEEVPRARRAPEFNTEICWNCGAPSNEHVQFNRMPAEKVAKNHRRVIGGRPRNGGFLSRVTRPNKSSPLLRASTKTNYITQPIDHFNDTNKNTYKQMFFSNDYYYKTGGPIFLFISGESAADSGWISDEGIPLLDWAARYNAMLYMVEHRFYGSSQPFKNMKIDNLKYLTSEQALADLATFIAQVNKDKGYTNPRWISYGGSYAGSLSAWFREVYPDITFAAIGSSGPVQAEVDFYGYLQTVEASLRSYSDKCADNLKLALDKIHELFTTVEGRQILNQKLSVEPPFDDEPLDTFSTFEFFMEVIGPLMGQVQYSDMEDGVENICNSLTDDSTDDPIDRLQGARYYEGTGHDFQSTINEFKYDGDERAWFWQTCNEFGFYQSSDIGRAAFGSAVPVNYYLRWCSDAYDSSLVRDKLEQNMEVTNQKYGGSRGYKSSKVLQLYGTIDPWHSIGYYNQAEGDHGEDVVSILINGTSHCSDMNGNDKARDALKTVVKYLDKWLK